jgi:iron uptake system component EfeO
MTSPRLVGALALVAAGSVLLAGCVAKTDAAASATIAVTSTADACDVSASTAKSGTLAFEVTNAGSDVTVFYLLAKDGLRIVGEAENIAPGASRTLTVVAQPGDYYTVCKPGMTGDGVGRAAFTVTGDRVAVEGEGAGQHKDAIDGYAEFVEEQVGQLVPAVQAFVVAYKAGDDDAARTQFPQVRAYYERIEPIAEALGDLDPRLDYREVDAVAEGIAWTGFHRIEKDLWVPAQDALNADGETPAWQDWAPSTHAQRAEYGDQLVADVQELHDYVNSADFASTLEDQGVAGLSNGAIALLDEVATGKITGEEDWWSGTDLSDFAANVEGSKTAFSLVEDLATAKGDDGSALVAQIDAAYADLEAALAAHGSLAAGFVDYRTVSDQERRALADLLNALAEPLSQLTATVLD